ncbi:MAG: hypothetical protein ACLFVU_10845 [Phycisphaerae bacterium]
MKRFVVLFLLGLAVVAGGCSQGASYSLYGEEFVVVDAPRETVFEARNRAVSQLTADGGKLVDMGIDWTSPGDTTTSRGFSELKTADGNTIRIEEITVPDAAVLMITSDSDQGQPAAVNALAEQLSKQGLTARK